MRQLVLARLDLPTYVGTYVVHGPEREDTERTTNDASLKRALESQ